MTPRRHATSTAPRHARSRCASAITVDAARVTESFPQREETCMESTTLEEQRQHIGRWLATAAVVALVVAGCSPKLEEGDVLEKNGDTFTIRLTKKIDEPIDKVWQGFQTPDRLEKYSEQYQQTKL